MTRRRTHQPDIDDFTPVSGGYRSQGATVRDDVTHLSDVHCSSQLDRHIVQLLLLHPQFRVRFAKQDLSQFSDQAKRELLIDMNDLLDIKD